MEKQEVVTKAGTIIDASFVEVPRQQWNTREENELIKAGQTPPEWKSRVIPPQKGRVAGVGVRGASPVRGPAACPWPLLKDESPVKFLPLNIGILSSC